VRIWFNIIVNLQLRYNTVKFVMNTGGVCGAGCLKSLYGIRTDAEKFMNERITGFGQLGLNLVVIYGVARKLSLDSDMLYRQKQ